MKNLTIRGQKENKKEKQQQKAIIPYIENNPDIENQEHNQKTIDVKKIVEFCFNNEFGLSNVNAKQQLLSWFV
ncbi:hypothetical protein [Metabacillus sediminilitoris]|uniref:hypothetical protein n=1 Tax=Metabacillus sediminilitoris TaxID=2567941 RepID=UPI001454D0E2|nr:hypothetical protein [Metabacillus sediminilitoris]